MTTLERVRAEIDKKMEEPQYQHEGEDWIIGLIIACDIIDKYAEQEQETTVSVLPDENGYYPNVCGMCANAESELCEWCGGNKNFKKSTTKIPNSYKKYAEQEPSEIWSIKDVTDAFERYGLIKEQEPTTRQSCENCKILELLVDMEIPTICEDDYNDCEYCENNCHFKAPTKACYLHWAEHKRKAVSKCHTV